jgi:5'-nucleotidase
MTSYGRFCLNRFNQIKAFRTTSLGLRAYRDRLDERVDPRGRPYYWIGGDTPTGIPEDGTDIGALSEGYISFSPLQLDLTAIIHRDG